MPNRTSDPEGFAAWLVRITSGNQSVLKAIAALDRPAADESVLTGLFAQRKRANQIYLQPAAAFKAGQTRTGEQFLRDAADIEEEYRIAAKKYGFRICVGSDTPGR